MKLLNKSIRSYLLYAILILLIAIPTLYFAIQSIVTEDVDESLVAQKTKIAGSLENTRSFHNLPQPGIFEPDTKLIPAESTSAKHDRFYTISTYDEISRENIPYRILETPVQINGKTFILQLKSSLLDSEDLIENIVMIVGALLFLIIVGLVLINRLLSKKLWAPFYNTIDKLRAFRIEGNGLPYFEETTITEFTVLNKAIASLINRNREVYYLQKEFTENVSHEMQTPLAIFQSKVELLMQTVPMTHEQSELLAELSQAGQRMNRLYKALLLLAKIDNNQFPDKEQINIAGTVNKLLDQYSNALEEKNIIVQKTAFPPMFIAANRTLMEVLTGNLLSNAIRHNNRGGIVKISIHNNSLEIANEGIPAELDSRKLFQRFKKQSSNSNSIGLGLAMTKKICQVSGFQIAYHYSHPFHIFKVHFNPS